MKKTILVALVLLALGVAMRLLPHPANFAPITAIALFAGYYLPRKWAIILPIAAMLIGDLFIGFYDWRLMAVVYLSFALISFLGWAIKGRGAGAVIISALTASIGFFLITNFAVWLFSSWYPHTLAGLLWCYTLALPFFRNTLLGDLFFTGVLFGAYEAVKALAGFKLSRVFVDIRKS